MTTAPDTEISRVGQLVMARLLAAGDAGATWNALKKDLEPLLGHRWAGSELERQLRGELAALEGASLAVVVRKGKTEKPTLTPAGRRRTLANLGIDELPPKTTWSQLKKTYVAARVLGIAAPRGESAKAFNGDPGFRALLLNRTFALGLGDRPGLDAAINALVWMLMGFPPAPAMSADAVKSALIRRKLGTEPAVDPRPKPKPRDEVAKLLAQHFGARQSGKDELRWAVIRHWIDGTPAPAAPSPRPLDGAPFAARVVEAAQASTSGRFGAGKVFIAHVWDALREDPQLAALGAQGFKRRLAEAHHAGLLTLSRADLVEAMNQDDVRQSEVEYEGATFHFVRI